MSYQYIKVEAKPAPLADILDWNSPTNAGIARETALAYAAPQLYDALRLATRFLADNYTDADMPDILPACLAALAKVAS